MSWVFLHPVFVSLGLAIGYWQLRMRYRSSGLSQEQQIGLGLSAFVGAMIGAKLPFLWEQWSLSPVVWLADGKTILGGIFGAYLAVECGKLLLGIRSRTGDYFAIPAAIAIGFGRLGCFAAGCCFGIQTDLPWGMSFPLAGDEAGVCRHPTQLYEAAFHFIACGGLYLLECKRWFAGRILTIYLASYVIFRFATEFLRPEAILYSGLTWYQWACIVLLLLLLIADAAASFRSRSVDTESIMLE